MDNIHRLIWLHKLTNNVTITILDKIDINKIGDSLKCPPHLSVSCLKQPAKASMDRMQELVCHVLIIVMCQRITTVSFTV